MEKILRSIVAMGVGFTFYAPILANANETVGEQDEIETVVVWGTRNPLSQTDKSPSSNFTPLDLSSVNITTTEDLLKYEPGIIIRKRFIGDSNGTMGIRGANMFQTSRSMVFADGVPLHNFLQTRWNGAPRWSLVSADEIAEIDVSYGPFSAEYPGNSMGGVINIETAIPTTRKFHADLFTFQQDFSSLGFNEDLVGYKGFVSYGDKFGDFSIYTSFNRLVNDGHPQNFYFSTDKHAPDSTVSTFVSGGYPDVNEYDEPATYYGSSGLSQVSADQFKIKIGYESNYWFTVVNVAFEDRTSNNKSVQNYLFDTEGNPIWNGWVEQDGFQFEIDSDDFSYDKSERQTLLVGGRTRGQLSTDWHMELGASYFDVSRDNSYQTNAHPVDPVFQYEYVLSKEYGDTGWATVDIKLLGEELFSITDLTLMIGFHYDRYQLELVNSSGGKTRTQAAFAQMDYRYSDQWRVSLGSRYEQWQSDDGFYSNRGDFQEHPDRNSDHFSPKFSVKYSSHDWHLTYSLAKAYRFPIVEELFQNERTTRSRSVANASLEPENGLHLNLGAMRSLGSGTITINLFREKVKDVIYSQTGTLGGTTLRTFLPVTEVTTNGADLTIHQYNLLTWNLDLRFNASYLDSRITRNDPNTSIEGNDFPRMPRWRVNLIATWHVNQQWDIGGGIRFASDSFGDLDNSDTANQVFGAHDEFTFVNVKTSYAISKNTKLSLGMDNITNEVAFVHHPWPGRTLFLNLSLNY